MLIARTSRMDQREDVGSGVVRQAGPRFDKDAEVGTVAGGLRRSAPLSAKLCSLDLVISRVVCNTCVAESNRGNHDTAKNQIVSSVGKVAPPGSLFKQTHFKLNWALDWVVD